MVVNPTTAITTSTLTVAADSYNVDGRSADRIGA